MDERKNNLLKTAEEEYRKKIIDMIWQIEDEKFLKRVYISIRDYINGK